MILSNDVVAQNEILYKEVDTTKLYLEAHYPPSWDSTRTYPAIIFFFGGGWNGGDRSHFKHHANYFSKRGLVCFLADYRTKQNSGTTPFESLKDAKSAIRYLRKNTRALHIDPNKIIGSGGSAGGHLAAAAAMIEEFNDASDDLSVSCKPNALVLYNPVIDNGPGGYGYERIGDQYKDFSPLHNIRPGAPPTIFFLGTRDSLVPVETAEYYCMVMKAISSPCTLHLYEGQGHGFFNYRNFDYYKLTVEETDHFLQVNGYLTNQPQVMIE
ncbi:alpha/beta hydrolase [Portibacter marinus]|uniref:alpha/beta hydrolase n=1 Tax=Portibacter marinus TaxID=2898660 RepID=UPI001F418F7C|nr:alpha/beta hydrolase fold domain-containing protein [Portibacter marinus]